MALDDVDAEELDRALIAIKAFISEAEEVEVDDCSGVFVPMQVYNEVHDGFKELKRLLKQEGLLK